MSAPRCADANERLTPGFLWQPSLQERDSRMSWRVPQGSVYCSVRTRDPGVGTSQWGPLAESDSHILSPQGRPGHQRVGGRHRGQNHPQSHLKHKPLKPRATLNGWRLLLAPALPMSHAWHFARRAHHHLRVWGEVPAEPSCAGRRRGGSPGPPVALWSAGLTCLPWKVGVRDCPWVVGRVP